MRSPLAQVGVIPIDWVALAKAVPGARAAPLFELLNEEFISDGDGTPGGSREEILAAGEFGQALQQGQIGPRDLGDEG